ncbi:unnamed protein product, partial [Mesorhabditis spiculigera]
MRRFIPLFIGLLLAVDAFPGYNPESFPDSDTQPALCSQSKRSLLCDPNRLLLPADNNTENYDKINDKLGQLRYNTTCTCGATDTNLGVCGQIGTWGFTASIAVVDRMILGENQHDRDSVMSAIEEFATRLRRRFPRGNCDDDIFIVLSVNDLAVWTSVGKVAERYLTNELVNTVTIRAESYFKRSKWTDGLSYMLDSYTKILNGQRIEPLDVDEWVWPIPKWAVIVLGVVVGLLLLAVVGLIIYCIARCFCCKDRRGNYSTVNRNQYHL